MCGIFEDMHVMVPDITRLLIRQEGGLYAMPVDLVTDGKILYDVLTRGEDHRPMTRASSFGRFGSESGSHEAR